MGKQSGEAGDDSQTRHQFVACPGCGQSCNLELRSCWNCDLALSTPAEDSVPTVASAAGRKALPQALESTAAANDATTIFRGAIGSASTLKIRCYTCGKKFFGTVEQIESLEACHGCKSSPFKWIPAEA